MVIKSFSKKPVVIEAIQWQGDNFKEIDLWNGKSEIKLAEVSETLHIKTLEGVMIADKMDWIIKGVAGEFYPCKPDIFEKTYNMGGIEKLEKLEVILPHKKNKVKFQLRLKFEGDSTSVCNFSEEFDLINDITTILQRQKYREKE